MIPGHDVKEGAAGSAPPFPGETGRAAQITGPAGMTGGSSYAPLTRPDRRMYVCPLHFCYRRPADGLPAYGMLPRLRCPRSVDS